VAQATAENIPLRGGRLCLDFTNTVDWSADGEPLSAATDALRTPDELRRWGRRLGLVAGDGPSPDDAELDRARRLRPVLYRVLTAVAAGREPSSPDLRALDAEHVAATEAGSLTRRGGVWRTGWADGAAPTVRFAVALDVVGLLGDATLLPRVRRCPGPDCGWLFLDTSGRRRWCSMRTCGSRAKMRRLAARRHTGSLTG
jgi:predicted RNA-binding Zn ribbon-like protein